MNEATSTGTERHETFVIKAALPDNAEEVLEGDVQSDSAEVSDVNEVQELDEAQRVIEALEAAYPVEEGATDGWEVLRSETVGPKVSGEQVLRRSWSL